MKPTMYARHRPFDPRFSDAEKAAAEADDPRMDYDRVRYDDLIDHHHQALLDEVVLDTAYLALLEEYEEMETHPPLHEASFPYRFGG